MAYDKTARAPRILRIDASARRRGSVSRKLGDRLIARLKADAPDATVTRRDLADGAPLLTEDWVGANFTPEEERSAAQRKILSESDRYVAELQAADLIVIGAPVYNFGLPAALKAWVDQIARARLTFKYTEDGPVGLLTGKKAVLLVASGGTEAGSEIDFATPYLRHVLGFVGIADVEVIAADRLMAEGDAKIAAAEAQIDALAKTLISA